MSTYQGGGNEVKLACEIKNTKKKYILPSNLILSAFQFCLHPQINFSRTNNLIYFMLVSNIHVPLSSNYWKELSLLKQRSLFIT